MLFMVCVSAFVPVVWVMAVGVGVFWWWVFQCRVAVVCASRRVPGVVVCVSWLVSGACLGVVWLVFGVGGLVWACFGVGWLVSGVSGVCAGVVWLVLVGVCWLVCVLWWFRMLTCLASFFFLGFVFCFVSCLVNNGLPGCVGAGGCLLVGCLGWCGCVLVARRGVGWWLVVFVLVCGRVGVFCGRVEVCLSASCGLLGCCLCVGLAWCACGATGCCPCL